MARTATGGVVLRRVLAAQVFFTGVQALPVIVFTAVALGTLVITQTMSFLPFLGGATEAARVAFWVVVRELAPLFTALIVIGRSGTAITTELGNMKLDRELEVLESLGINRNYFVVFPRLLGVTAAVVALTVVFAVAALAGGYVVTAALELAPLPFHAGAFLDVLVFRDVVLSVVKAGFFGFFIALLHCHHGLSLEKAVTEVPRLTTRAVVQSIFLCFGLNVFLSVVVFPV